MNHTADHCPSQVVPAEGQVHLELVKHSPQFEMMESELFWLELDEDRWCHPLQVVPFQLAREPPFLVFLGFGGVDGEGMGGWRW